jgi:GxxExxY protein
MTENEISKIVFDLGMKVHRTLGPGLLESSYEECLFYELTNSKLKVERQKLLPVVYEGVRMETSYRIDLMIEDKLILELKAVENITDLHLAQLLTYLKLSNCKLGMVINFNVPLFKNGVKRVINGQLEKY